MINDQRLTTLSTRRFIQIPGPNPILITGGEDEWDGNFIECCNVLKDGETYYLYYHGYPKDKNKWLREGYRIGVASAPHPLGPWKKHEENPIIDLGPEGSWEDEWVACAAVLKEGEKRYYMFYSANFRVGLAYASHPLGPWKKYEKNPIIAENFGYIGGVVKVNGKYHMINEFPVDKNSPDQGPMALATADRLEGPWQSYEGNPVLAPDEWGAWEDGGYSESGVLYHDGVFHMFYGGTKWEKLETAGYACSLDGFHWMKHVDNPVAPRENNPDASAFAEVHALWEYPFYYVYHTLRYSSRADFEPWAEDIGVQILATDTPFRLSMPAVSLESLAPGQISDLNHPLYESGRTARLSGCPPISLTAASSVSLTTECTCHEKAERSLRVHVKSSSDGIHFDTEDLCSFDIAPKAGERVRKTQGLQAEVMYIKVQVENLDKKQAVSDVRVTVTLGR